MRRGRHPIRKGGAPPGVWLAFPAVAVQVLLRFLLAYEVALAVRQVYGDTTTVICSAFHAPTAPASLSAASYPSRAPPLGL